MSGDLRLDRNTDITFGNAKLILEMKKCRRMSHVESLKPLGEPGARERGRSFQANWTNSSARAELHANSFEILQAKVKIWNSSGHY